MKETILILFFSIALLSYSAKAQLQIIPSGNLLLAQGRSFAGASLSGRYFVSPRVAMGVNLRYIPTINLLMSTLEIDYFFLPDKSVRPYIGLEAGLLGEYTDKTSSSRKTVGVGPKVGLQGRLSPQIGWQLEAGYPVAIQRYEPFGSDSGLLLGAGFNLYFGDRK